MTFNGTVQEVHTEVIKLNPNWDREYLWNSSIDVQETKEIKVLKKRTLFSYIRCNTFAKGQKSVFEEGIRYLRGVRGQPHEGPSGKCGRVSCSWGAGIWWCNDVSIVLD